MRRSPLAGVLVGAALVGCDPDGRSPAADASSDGAFDAAPDALPRPRNDPGPGPDKQPFDVTFGTPAGDFVASYLFAQAVWGDCDPPSWELRFSTAENGTGPSVTLRISLPPYAGVEVSGTRPASAHYLSPEPLVSHGTQSATFEATRIDYPGEGAPRLTGRFLVTDPAWAIDVDLDVLAISTGCI